MTTPSILPMDREIRLGVFAILLALIHGVLYVWTVPPWQHYDEPNHFEYAWLAANLDHWPAPGDEQAEFSRRVVESMKANGFYANLVEPPPEDPQKVPGLSQLKEPPLYYFLASLPLSVMTAASLEDQLVAVRLISLLFYLFTVFVAWMLIREITAEANPLRWMLPLTLALIPGFVDAMTAANNDSAAVALFSFFLWGSVRLIRRGFSVEDFLWVTGSAALAYWTKNTAMVALPLLPVVWLLGAMRGRLRAVAGAVVLSGFILLPLLFFTWGDAALWLRATLQAEPTRLASSRAIAGENVFYLSNENHAAKVFPAPLFQLIPTEVSRQIAGQVVTVAGWVWADAETEMQTPSINAPDWVVFRWIPIGVEPTFFAYTITVPQGVERVWINITPNLSPKAEVRDIYYDGLVLASGEFPLQQVPRFDTGQADRGVWGDKAFINLIRNPSAEKSGPRARPWLDQYGARFLPDRTKPSMIVASLLDLPGSGFMYWLSIRRLFMTFWGWFGWGHIPLIFLQLYSLLGGLVLVVSVGFAGWLASNGRRLRWDIALILGLALLFSWGVTLTRGVVFLNFYRLYLPVARHSYPVIIPTLMILCLGWMWLAQKAAAALASRPGSNPSQMDVRQQNLVTGFYLTWMLILLLLDLVSIWSIASYFSASGI